MKTELRAKPQAIPSVQTIIELWHDGKHIGTIAGAYGPGVRIISSHFISATTLPDDGSGVKVLEIGIEQRKEQAE